MSLGGAVGPNPAGRAGDKGLKLSLADTLRQAWAEEDLRKRIIFVLSVFAIYAFGINVPVAVPGLTPGDVQALVEDNAFLQLLNTLGGGAFQRISVFALGLGPYITASIIMQVLTQSTPAWKKELQEGGEYARRQQNKRTRTLTLFLCMFQGYFLLQTLTASIPSVTLSPLVMVATAIMWTGGSMFLLWLGEQVSERGIGNGVSLIIFAGIVISFPGIVELIAAGVRDGNLAWWTVALIAAVFLATTAFVVTFTVAQRRIPIQHMRRNFGTQAMGGKTSYLPISVNMAGVIPIIFAVSLIYLPAQLASFVPPTNEALHGAVNGFARFFTPDLQSGWQGLVGVVVYCLLIFLFTFFWNAIMYPVEDIANNLKRSGSYIPGIRPGKQTMEFLNGVITRVTFVGAVFLSIAALTQYVFPLFARGIPSLGLIGGTSLLIMVSVALEFMRQIESNILSKQYGG